MLKRFNSITVELNQQGVGKVPGQMEGAARDQGSAEGNHDNPSDKLLDSHAIFALQVFVNQNENWNINI